MIGIYKITSPSKRIYIGQSQDIEFRWSFYLKMYCNKQTRLYNSLKKYGPENHIFEVIEECDINMLDKREIYWKEIYKSYKDGLNCCLYDSSPMRDRIHSEETRKKISESRKGWKPDDSRSLKISIKTKGLKRTDEQKKNMSDGSKGKPKPCGFGDIISKKKTGVKLGPMSDEHKLKISQNRKFKGKKIIQYDLNHNYIRTWNSISEATNFYKGGSISDACRNKIKTSKGFIWEYDDNDSDFLK